MHPCELGSTTVDIGDVVSRSYITVRMRGKRKAMLRFRLARPIFSLACRIAGMGGVEYKE